MLETVLKTYFWIINILFLFLRNICIKLIKSDSKDIYNAVKDLCFK